MSSARIDRGGGETFKSYTRLTPTDTPLKVPPIEDVLVAYLNLTFPDKLSLVEMMGSVEGARAARKVVEHLVDINRQQNTKDT